MLLIIYRTFLRGQPGHRNLAGVTFVEAVRAAPRYRLYDVEGLPALVPADDGVAIAAQGVDVSDYRKS